MTIRVISFNLRLNTPHDGIHAWPYRMSDVMTFLHANDFDVMGFQEVTPDMYQALNDSLSTYDSYGIARDIGSEASPVFIKKSYEVIEEGTFFLTDTPYVPSKLDCSVFPRIATYVIIKTTDLNLMFVNTHLDYLDGTCIYHQAEYLYQVISEIKERHQASVILTGDFNQHPDSMAIRFLSTKFRHIFEVSHDQQLTFHNYTDDRIGHPIDYIFYDEDIEMIQSEIIHHQGSMLSDHYPIVSTLKIPTKKPL